MIEKFSIDGFFNEFGEIYPGLPLSEEEKKEKLYHYTSFDTFVKIWLSKRFLTLTMRHPRRLMGRSAA